MADKVVYHDAPKTEEHFDTAVADAVKAEPAEVETTDRGLFGFFGKKDEEKKCDESAISSEFESKVHVSEPEPKAEEKHEVKHETLVEKFRQADSSSSSSSDEEECVDGEKRKKKKGLKEKLQDKIEERKEKAEHDTSVPVEKCDDVAVAPPLGQISDPTPTPAPALAPEPEEKKGFMEKIKEKLPGGHKKPEEEHVASPPPASVAAHDSTAAVEDEPKEKKGIFEKIKEKIPGYHGKTTEEEKKEKECD